MPIIAGIIQVDHRRRSRASLAASLVQPRSIATDISFSPFSVVDGGPPGIGDRARRGQTGLARKRVRRGGRATPPPRVLASSRMEAARITDTFLCNGVSDRSQQGGAAITTDDYWRKGTSCCGRSAASFQWRNRQASSRRDAVVKCNSVSAVCGEVAMAPSCMLLPDVARQISLVPHGALAAASRRAGFHCGHRRRRLHSGLFDLQWRSCHCLHQRQGYDRTRTEISASSDSRRRRWQRRVFPGRSSA